MFIEERFPTAISYGSAGGPTYNTTIVDGLSGVKSKNINWQYPLHKYDAVYGIKTIDEMYQLLEFFHIAQGRAHVFRYKDWADYNSVIPGHATSAFDQLIGVGDGSNRNFQIVKQYGVGSYTKSRIITKPVSGTLKVSVNGSVTSAYTVNDMGVITFTSAPANGVDVRCGYEFDIPAAFDTDSLSSSYEQYQNLSCTVPIVEERI
ncbi:hypothetical protein vBAcoSR7M_37 [Alteromonas phage vB_AcoS-R7M]|uniref:DUF2460 domain-containing protein n=1 Tax=Alteromonas phage vB_AcoS-R7M TaxID=2729541 RepID=A0A6M3YN66_9CAUD|nr:glycoside hydrolase [Alteromonas phage vB_AcoS-R7M]QJI53359.1 hypothetical protein vBAcoSR7M_37 [Alteromonas phage vB_AcoS-R7M]